MSLTVDLECLDTKSLTPSTSHVQIPLPVPLFLSNPAQTTSHRLGNTGTVVLVGLGWAVLCWGPHGTSRSKTEMWVQPGGLSQGGYPRGVIQGGYPRGASLTAPGPSQPFLDTVGQTLFAQKGMKIKQIWCKDRQS